MRGPPEFRNRKKLAESRIDKKEHNHDPFKNKQTICVDSCVGAFGARRACIRRTADFG